MEPSEAGAIRLTPPEHPDGVEKVAAIVAPPDPSRAADVTTLIMVPFRSICASRWSAGKYGVLYAAFEIATAVTEHGFHLARVARDTMLGREVFGRFHLSFEVKASLADVRRYPRFSDPDDYSFAQERGDQLVAAGEAGVVYGSARKQGGTCAGVFSPSVVRDAAIVARVGYSWDGARLEAFDQPISPLVF